MTSKSDIDEWFERGVQKGATHLIVCTDTFSYEDYPSYVMPGENAREAYEKKIASPMTNVMEVYDLKKSKEDQLALRRSFNF